jgi:hypothetical protein
MMYDDGLHEIYSRQTGKKKKGGFGHGTHAYQVLDEALDCSEHCNK